MGIYIWGTGCGASELLEQGLDLETVRGFVDSFPSGETFLGKPVLLPENLNTEDCDLLIITTRHADPIAKRCEELGIPKEKCLFLKNNHILQNRNDDCTHAEEVLGAELLCKLLPKQHIVPTPTRLSKSILTEQELQNDYVRLATLELLCKRLKDIPGAVAELGVYRGFFARCMQMLLPERKLYLFDSFEGFREDAGASASFQAAHANTAVDKVLSIMPNSQNVIVKPGFFPESLGGLEESFCLVSLDVDFQETTLAGLRYFWPRIEKGGYLLLHDWGSPKLPGVAEALCRFEAEVGRPLPAVPLCDVGGSLVLCK